MELSFGMRAGECGQVQTDYYVKAERLLAAVSPPFPSSTAAYI
jgi:hypothetical protein